MRLGQGATDAQMVQVGRLTTLTEVSIDEGEITDAGLAPLARLSRLEELNLRDPRADSPPRAWSPCGG